MAKGDQVRVRVRRARPEDDDELVANAREHAKDAHNMEITREQALELSESA